MQQKMTLRDRYDNIRYWKDEIAKRTDLAIEETVSFGKVSETTQSLIANAKVIVQWYCR